MNWACRGRATNGSGASFACTDGDLWSPGLARRCSTSPSRGARPSRSSRPSSSAEPDLATSCYKDLELFVVVVVVVGRGLGLFHLGLEQVLRALEVALFDENLRRTDHPGAD